MAEGITHREKELCARMVAKDEPHISNRHPFYVARKNFLTLGAWKAFEWLEANGYRVVKVDGKKD